MFTVDLTTSGTSQTLIANTTAAAGFNEVARTYRCVIMQEVAF